MKPKKRKVLDYAVQLQEGDIAIGSIEIYEPNKESDEWGCKVVLTRENQRTTITKYGESAFEALCAGVNLAWAWKYRLLKSPRAF